MLNLLAKVTKIGLEDDLPYWKVNMVRKVNTLTIFAIFNTLSGLVYFLYLGIFSWWLSCAIVLGIAPFVYILNSTKNYLAASYLFLLIGAFFVYWLTLILGLETQVQLFYFPLLLTVVQLLGRKELIVHMLINAGFYLIGMILIYLYPSHFDDNKIPIEYLSSISLFCVVLSFVSSIVVVSLITLENSRQEQKINKIVKEKEILLAEVFHRVKNNMSIVTSLISLRKNASNSQEVKDALEDCRSRVFSMALIHREMLSASNIGQINFKEFIEKLVENIGHSMGEMANLTLTCDTEILDIDPNKAVPCGLIINELITNAFKHAHAPNKPLKIDVYLRIAYGKAMIEVADNGSGIKLSTFQEDDSLGMELFKSLCEQIDANYEVKTSDEGTSVSFLFDR